MVQPCALAVFWFLALSAAANRMCAAEGLPVDA